MYVLFVVNCHNQHQSTYGHSDFEQNMTQCHCQFDVGEKPTEMQSEHIYKISETHMNGQT